MKSIFFLSLFLVFTSQYGFEIVEKIDPDVPNYASQSADYIFNDDVLHTIEVNLPAENLAEIDADPAAEKYVRANLLFEGETLEGVGLRYKGSIGSFVNCVSGENWIKPSGHKTCTKLSMKIKVDWKGADQSFYGMKKIQLHSMNHDKSQMRDRLGYLLFSEMGVPSPRSTHARVVINGQYVGLFALIEQIDDRFTDLHFDDKDGELFKEVWPLDMHGKANDKSALFEHLEGKRKDIAQVDLFHKFGSAIAAAEETDLKNVISTWMDIDKIMAYAVVDRAIRADDGPFHWYCFEGGCAPHNFYWYANAETGKVYLLPWDMDNAFQNMTEDKNPVTPIADAWGETRNDCQPFAYGKFEILQRSAACDKLTRGWTLFEDEYRAKMEQLMTGPFSQENVNKLISKWSSQIREATIEASKIHDDAVTEELWEKAMATLKEDVKIAHERYAANKNAE